MRPRKQPRQQRSKVTVTAILDATAHILIEDGYTALNTNRVAEKAGVSIGSLYQYFPDKTSLLAALRQRHAEYMKARLQTALENIDARPLKETVSTLVHAVFEAHLLEPALHKILQTEIPEPALYDEQTNLESDFQIIVASLLNDRQDQIRAIDSELASRILINVVESLIHAAVIDNNFKEDASKIENEIVTMITLYLQK